MISPNILIKKEKKIIPINYFNISLMSCCMNKYNIKDFRIIYTLIEELDDLEIWQKNLLLTRFIHIYKYIKNYYIYICRCYSFSKLFIIVVGIVNPALLSINHDQNNKYYVLIYWSVWLLQLVVSIMTALISFFKWDKKYFLYTNYKAKIEQEIWLYLELTGKYCILETEYEISNNKTTHSSKLNIFLTKIEGLYKKLKDSDLEIEDIDEENDNKSSNETSQLLKSELNDYEKNVSDDKYQEYILSQLKILLNDIKPYILEHSNNKLQYNTILEKKNNNSNDYNKEEEELLLNNISNSEQQISNKIKQDYNNIKKNISDTTKLKNEIESFFKTNNISDDYYNIFN